MANPEFYPEADTPQAFDPKQVILNKILGAILNVFTPVTNTNPTFFPEGHQPQAFDNENRILMKILGAILDSSGGGGGGGLSGAGSPEGVETANPGTTYWNTSDRSLWIKDTETGDTGWIKLLS
jgi:hypothetical protein